MFLWNHLSFTSRDAGDFYAHVLCKVFIAIAITGTVYSLQYCLGIRPTGPLATDAVDSSARAVIGRHRHRRHRCRCSDVATTGTEVCLPSDTQTRRLPRSSGRLCAVLVS